MQSSSLNEELLKGCVIMRKRQKGGAGEEERDRRMGGRKNENKGVWGHFFMRRESPSKITFNVLSKIPKYEL